MNLSLKIISEKKGKIINSVLLSVIVICVIMIGISVFLTAYIDSWTKIKNVDYTVGMAVALPTLAIAIIAYSNLKSISQSSIDQVVMALDTHWRSEQIIRARKIVDQIFQTQYRINGGHKGDYIASLADVSLELYQLSRPGSLQELTNHKSEFIEVLSLIEFFDTLGYLHKKSNEEVRSQIEVLFKSSIIFYYEVCRVYIKNCHHHDKDRFSNFESLHIKITNLNN